MIGTIELKFTKGTGTFCCPHCEQERTYRHRTRRLFLDRLLHSAHPAAAVGRVH